jgi:hemerythrin-like domain-containing protein
MRSTDDLKNEHRLIEKVLSELEDIAQRAGDQGAIEREPADRALEILRNFADKCHHGKEERHLFALLEERGMSLDRGPLAVMLTEHEEGRRHIRAMVESVPGAANGEGQAVDTFIEHAEAYVALLRQHIQKEDTVLYPMAENLLSAQDDERLEEGFEAIERDEMGEGTHQKYHRWVEEMAD